MDTFTFKVNGDLTQEDLAILNELILNEELVISIDKAAASVPGTYSLEQNYPNPFNPVTSIKYQIPEATQVKLVIYNLLGQVVRTLVDDVKTAGIYEVKWDGTGDQGVKLASGIYIYRLEAGNFTKTRKLVFMK